MSMAYEWDAMDHTPTLEALPDGRWEKPIPYSALHCCWAAVAGPEAGCTGDRSLPPEIGCLTLEQILQLATLHWCRLLHPHRKADC